MLYINPLTIFLIIFLFITDHIIPFLICYSSMLIHELSHLAAALIIGLSPNRLALQPYGVCLTLKNKIIYSFADELILYLSGPLINIILAFLCMLIFGRGKYTDYFYVCNLFLFFMNMMPVKPLDGGILLNKALIRCLNIKFAAKICQILSFVFFVFFLTIGIVIVKKSHFNISALLIAVLLLSNAFMQDEKYSIDFLREFLFQKEKRKIPIHTKTNIIVADKDTASYKLAMLFKSKKYNLIFFNDNGKIKNIKTENEIIDSILKQ